MSEKAEYSTTDPPPLIFIAVAQTTMTQQHKAVWNYPGEIDRYYYCNYQLDGSEQPMESLSLIDAVMPDVVASRQQQMQNI
ncbi:hypothetical protein DAPPUDRAFT_260543 [Daphnia pulex]|uniref:Uncharacterized protein n=1 Tax=Daphnia pulex TaxID=6669 RepID=E9HJE6_DAPPU|nr:hypothetical protein DAPPUDRAFT_260543 [Daphnia pulex]|eukprot:EFX68157.1 hypothetical protein DAPPUDRAFT_260543 [Daphnia pulex]